MTTISSAFLYTLAGEVIAPLRFTVVDSFRGWLTVHSHTILRDEHCLITFMTPDGWTVEARWCENEDVTSSQAL